MKLLRSKKYPDRQPQVMSDKDYEELKRKGLAVRFTATEFAPVRTIMPALKLPEVKKVVKTKKKINE